MKKNKLVEVGSRREFLTGTAVAATGAIAGCIGGGDDDDEFPADEMTWIVGSAPGGSFDTYARGFADYTPEHLPNEPNIVVENVEGAGGRRANNQMMDSEPDGNTFLSWNIPGELVTELFIDTDYDFEESTIIARIARLPYVLCVSEDSDWHSVEDLQNAGEITIGSSGPESTGSLVSVIGSSQMGIDFDMVFGYDGASEFLPATASGEIDAAYITPDTVQSFVEDDSLRLIVALDEDPPEYAPDTPTSVELGYDGLEDVSFTQVIGGPPEMPEERAEMLQDALISAADSEEMQEWADENDQPVDQVASREDAIEQIETGREIILENEEVINEYLVD